MMRTKTILVVESDDAVFAKIEAELRDKVRVLRAKTLIEGWCIFLERQNSIWLVMVNCCVESDTPDAMALVGRIKKLEPESAIIAYSDNLAHSDEVAKAGATHESMIEHAAYLALRLLGL